MRSGGRSWKSGCLIGAGSYCGEISRLVERFSSGISLMIRMTCIVRGVDGSCLVKSTEYLRKASATWVAT